MIDSFLYSLVFLSALLWAVLSLRISLQRLQQSSYRNNRYFRRLLGRDTALFWGDFRHISVLGALILWGLLCFTTGALHTSILVFTLILLGYVAPQTYFSVRDEKKAFVYTQRSSRLALVGLLLIAVIPSAVLFVVQLQVVVGPMLFWAAMVPLILPLANSLLLPLERSINNYYLRDAVRKRREFTNLRVIGITGSYGKTSTKNFLNTILARRYRSFTTARSINTELGLARVVREELTPLHEIFVAEMGAREPGDIRACADVVQPQWGVITCIGKAHLEMFGSEEAIRDTKSELIESLPPEGLCFLNADDPNTELVRKRSKCPVVLFGVENEQADLWAEEISVSDRGSTFTLRGPLLSEPLSLETRLLGRHAISNLVASIAVACKQEIPPSVIAQAVQSLRATQHRLELLDKGQDILVIDDAFNSNPAGFREALNVLSLFKDRRRILVTPGMVELGSAEYEENFNVAKFGADCVDFVVIVGSDTRREPLREGFLDGGLSNECIREVVTLKEAQSFLQTFNRPGDIILFENDLPDVYEG